MAKPAKPPVPSYREPHVLKTWRSSTISTVESTPVAGTNAVASDGDYGQIITQQASAPWQAGTLVFQDNYMDLTTTRTIEVDVYSDAATDILAKAVGAIGAGTDGATDASHPGGGWATLVFDIDVPKDGGAASVDQFEKLFFFLNYNFFFSFIKTKNLKSINIFKCFMKI